ncbi:MAG: dTDP-4-amino-4,6-dideoxygalactose transaminase [Chitinophagaceae bacterium]
MLPILPYALSLTEAEHQAMLIALQSGHLVGAGPISRRVEQQIQELFGVRHALLTASCTAALEMAMLTLDIGPGDEVILPGFTFVSTANCVVLRGAQPVFADICADTLNLDPEDVARRITPRTRAIMPVHYAGVACDMTALQNLADTHGLALIEDAAQGVGATYQGNYLGTVSTLGCYSFHATKNIVCGEGGALLTNDTTLAHKAEIIREKGTNRSAFLRGEIDKYTWVAAGSSYILSDLLASLLETQLPRFPAINKQRQVIWELYQNGLMGLAKQGHITLSVIPIYATSNYHIFFFLTQTTAEQEALITHLKTMGIPATFHYVPLHTAPFGRRVTDERVSLPITESAASRLVRLPIGTHITPEQANYVVQQVKAFYGYQ